MAHVLAYSSLVRCFSVVLLGVLMMGVGLGCENVSVNVDAIMFALLWAGTEIRGHRC